MRIAQTKTARRRVTARWPGLILAVVSVAACRGSEPTAPVIAEANLAVTLVEPTGSFTEVSPAEPFGTFKGKRYVRISGRFEGTTAQGAYRVPFELVVPENPTVGNGTLVFEPPHFGQKFAARDDYLGHDFLFGNGYRYASVGWSTWGWSIIEPGAADVFIAGAADDEILVQFVNALKHDADGQTLVGPVERYYGYGFSQTSWAMHRLLRSSAGLGLFDFTMLNATWWAGGGFAGPFSPVTGVGKVVIVQTEADLIISDGRVLRGAAAEAGEYRVYEVAGGAHIPDVPANHDNPVFGPLIVGTNPVDWPAVARAAFVAGDRWTRLGTAPSASRFIDDDGSGGADPVYGFVTGIARDDDLNALGGVRLPDVALGRGRYMAADGTQPIAWLTGSWTDISCDPGAGGEVRFPNHGRYVGPLTQIVTALRADGFLLQEDANRMVQQAGDSNVGQPGLCN